MSYCLLRAMVAIAIAMSMTISILVINDISGLQNPPANAQNQNNNTNKLTITDGIASGDVTD